MQPPRLEDFKAPCEQKLLEKEILRKCSFSFGMLKLMTLRSSDWRKSWLSKKSSTNAIIIRSSEFFHTPQPHLLVLGCRDSAQQILLGTGNQQNWQC